MILYALCCPPQLQILLISIQNRKLDPSVKKEEQTMKDLMLLLYIILVTLSLSPRRFTLEHVGCDYLVLRYVFNSHQIIQLHGKNTIIRLPCWLQGDGKTSLLSALIKQGKPRNEASQENIHLEITIKKQWLMESVILILLEGICRYGFCFSCLV